MQLTGHVIIQLSKCSQNSVALQITACIPACTSVHRHRGPAAQCLATPELSPGGYPLPTPHPSSWPVKNGRILLLPRMSPAPNSTAVLQDPHAGTAMLRDPHASSAVASCPVWYGWWLLQHPHDTAMHNAPNHWGGWHGPFPNVGLTGACHGAPGASVDPPCWHGAMGAQLCWLDCTQDPKHHHHGTVSTVAQ